MALPQAIFSNPSATLRRLIEDGVRFGDHLHDIACRQVHANGIGSPIQRTQEVRIDRLAVAVAIEFAEPRAPGEAYYAFAALRHANDAPIYYLCERTFGKEDAPIGTAAMLCAWSADADNKPGSHLNFGNLSRVDLAYFIEATLAHID
jgi:hypothetical protein